jgi:heparanase 1
MSEVFRRLSLILGLAALAVSCFLAAFPAEVSEPVNPASLPLIGQVDRRFQAYNIEMLEVTGGRFWKPYKDLEARSSGKVETQRPGSTPSGMSPNLYEYRPPINLTNARLRKLAAALGAAYVRVSGTWANTSYFYDADGPPPTTPPKGFNGVLTREQWKGVIDFAHAANAEIITSFATSAGTRNAEGVWTSDQARAFLSYTKSVGGRIAAAEFMNEPNFATLAGTPKGYNAAAYARDIAVFRPFLKQTAPDILFLGPGSAAEGGTLGNSVVMGRLRTEDLLRATGPVYDIFSYHLYPAASQRRAAGNPAVGTTAAAALSQEWLSRPDAIDAFYKELRDRFEPGKPMWITETADAACGGNPWASTFLDTFRYLDAHARLAQQGVRVIAHNTLAASDYGLLDETTFAPRPNYWAALLWHKLMGTTVLKPSASPAQALHVYAHCLSDAPGGVAVLAINTDGSSAQTLAVATSSERYTMTASKLEDTRVDLNGKELKLGADDSIPQLTGVQTASGRITLPAASITFLAIRGAHNAACL